MLILVQLFLLHLLIGAGVAVAVYLSPRLNRGSNRVFQVFTAWLFWPLYLPALLLPSENQRTEPRHPPTAAPEDELGRVIAQVDAELDEALNSLNGWAEEVLAREKSRLDELRKAWLTQADNIREIDQLLQKQDHCQLGDHWLNGSPAVQGSKRLHQSQQVIRQNIDRLKKVRERALADLLGTLGWVRELVSMIFLAKFTGAPAARAEELVAQIAAAVEGLSAVTWQDDDAGIISENMREPDKPKKQPESSQLRAI